MSSGWQRKLGVSGVSLMLVGSVIVAAPVTAWASAAAADTVPAPVPSASPSASASSVGRLPTGCTGVTPRKPWRLVVSRPTPTASEIDVQWSAVGCTTGYRVHVLGAGVDRQVEVAGGNSSSTVITDLVPTQSYHITVTSLGASGDGGVSGDFRLQRSGPASRAEVTIDFPDAGPAEPVALSANGTGPWVNPEVTWTAPAGPEPKGYRLKVTAGGGRTVVEKTVPGNVTKARLGDEIAAGVPYTLSMTTVLADGTDGDTARITFGDKQAPKPEQVTGNSPVVQFSPVTDQQYGRVLGYEIGFGAAQASKRVFVADRAAAGTASPWIAVDPTFAAVDASENGLPLAKMVTVVRTITTMGKSAWTPAETITHSEVATPAAAYFAGIGHLDGQETVPRNGFLNVHGASADLEVTDLVWSQSARQQAVPVTVAVYGPDGSSAPAFTQELAVTHLRDVAQDAWRASDLPLPDGWTSIVLRRGGTDVVRWVNTGGKPCVASVNYGDVPTDLPAMWRDSWCSA